MNKYRFRSDYFLESVKNGIVLQSMAFDFSSNTSQISVKSMPDFCSYDVSVCICSFKRTHHLPQILDSLWNGQTFKGNVEIIVWNNNSSRSHTVSEICDKYIVQSNEQKSLQLINSSKNYFCAVRLAMPQLMQSQRLLICDDDCIPGPEFIDFFVSKHNTYPEDVLCLRGHLFLEHKLNEQNPSNFWLDYENLRFVSDERPEQLVHFIHADVCLITKQALQECSSIPVPDSSYALVDDYWMSYVLNHKFNRKLRKLTTSGVPEDYIIKRTEDSDKIGLALYTRPEVIQTKVRVYIHHMLQGWPHWESNDENITQLDEKAMKVLTENKKHFWDQLFVGFNISSEISAESVEVLAEMGVKCVRIGAVGLGDKVDYEFKAFLNDKDEEMKRLKQTISLLKSKGIRVVLTLKKELSSPEIWEFIAKNLYSEEYVVAYDLINEPFTPLESQYVFEDNDPGMSELMVNYTEMIESIRLVDKMTPIIIESSYWANVDTLSNLSIDKLIEMDDNIMVSFHFYDPQLLTQRRRNQNRYSFPSQIPDFENIKWPKMTTIDGNFIDAKFLSAIQWSQKFNVKLVLGEFGISREVSGAHQYLDSIMKACKTYAISSFIYSFRDEEWDSMDYELETDVSTGSLKQELSQNILMQTIINGIRDNVN
ncbi:unnamed protein product [Medioppia subpectinata]|uniref:Uncharacterized protein n=1 Tax=Medioppia subpectinata TaxID=1979941 RepID=A0A7R9KP54_9ACAR|nr:unnamed protein product [Medioppia subpectinata]CAG2107225.1 unnamed protein product [Medioppia subpectinata]